MPKSTLAVLSANSAASVCARIASFFRKMCEASIFFAYLLREPAPATHPSSQFARLLQQD
jgi:hypothetical protein